MKKFILFPILFAVGCSSVSQQQHYTSADSKENFAIYAKSESGLSNKITVFINGQIATTGTLHDFKVRDTFSGQYKNHSVISECSQLMKWDDSYAFDCTVSIDGHYASHLTF